MALAPARSGFFLKFGEILLMCFVPIGMMQLFRSFTAWEVVIDKPVLLIAVLGGMILLSALIAWFWNKKGGGEKAHAILQTIAVLYLAFWISTYGAAKILGTQFQPPHFVLETPIGELSGFWLTWTYYGFSHTMALILGCTQIVGCVLILFRATRLPGVLILLPVMLNIDLIDHFYKISPYAYYNALHYTFFLLVLLLIDLPLIRTALLAYRDKVRVAPRRLALNGLKVLVILLAFYQITTLKGSFTARTNLNGVWRVDSLVQHQQTMIPAASGGKVWSKLYFEWRYGCIFKSDPAQFTDKDLNGDYAVDEKAGMLRIGFPREDTTKGAKPIVDSMALHYTLTKDSLMEMRGKYKGEDLEMYVKRLK